MKVILFRHGEKQHTDSKLDSDHKSVGLTDVGIIQIHKLGQTLKKRFPQLKSSSIIYSSPVGRTIQSAEIVKNILNIKEVSYVPEFAEFYPVKDYSQPNEIREHLFIQTLINPNLVLPGADFSLNQTLSIFEKKLTEICHNNNKKIILISSHGAIIRNFIYSIDPKFHPGNELIGHVRIHEGGYTVLNFDGKKFTVDQFDVHDFL
jgi:broad specificity phosphatase PhoE